MKWLTRWPFDEDYGCYFPHFGTGQAGEVNVEFPTFRSLFGSEPEWAYVASRFPKDVQDDIIGVTRANMGTRSGIRIRETTPQLGHAEERAGPSHSGSGGGGSAQPSGSAASCGPSVYLTSDPPIPCQERR